MEVKNIGFVILSDDVKAASSFYTTHFGFNALIVLDWFASHEHEAYKGVYFDIIKKGHESAGHALLNESTKGTMIALIVENAEKEFIRLTKEGVSMAMATKEEPWGQKRFQVYAPDGVIVEIIEQIAPDMEWMKNNI